jgi:hypothetical protein
MERLTLNQWGRISRPLPFPHEALSPPCACVHPLPCGVRVHWLRYRVRYRVRTLAQANRPLYPMILLGLFFIIALGILCAPR